MFVSRLSRKIFRQGRRQTVVVMMADWICVARQSCKPDSVHQITKQTRGTYLAMSTCIFHTAAMSHLAISGCILCKI